MPALGKFNGLTDVEGILVGNFTDLAAVSGVTVVLCPEGAVAAVDVRGAAPGTRDTDLLAPENLVEKAQAVALCGGSVYGLAAADGVAADVREKGYPSKLSSCLIGSCTNSSYEDLSRAADVARQATAHGVRAKTTLWVTPGSEQIHQTIRRDGQLDELAAIGGVVLANACGPCIGQWKRDDLQKGVANSILTSFNRNFPKSNDGSADTQAFIASPEIVIAYALAGRLDWNPLTDEIEWKDGKRFKLAPPAPAPEHGRRAASSRAARAISPRRPTAAASR